jgi:DNA-directed RNA polymerase beta' subunit
MKGVSAFHLDHDGNEWFVVTEGSNLRKMLAHPLIDNQRLYCNDVWEVYECLGIAATRKMLLKDLKKVVCGINLVHIQLLVDKMTFKGKPCSITRYTMRNNDVGPLSKATFEESTDILINAAMKTEIENNAGVSASIISGRQPKIGTGFMALLMDYTKLMEKQEPEETYY